MFLDDLTVVGLEVSCFVGVVVDEASDSPAVVFRDDVVVDVVDVVDVAVTEFIEDDEDILLLSLVVVTSSDVRFAWVDADDVSVASVFVVDRKLVAPVTLRSVVGPLVVVVWLLESVADIEEVVNGVVDSVVVLKIVVSVVVVVPVETVELSEALEGEWVDVVEAVVTVDGTSDPLVVVFGDVVVVDDDDDVATTEFIEDDEDVSLLSLVLSVVDGRFFWAGADKVSVVSTFVVGCKVVAEVVLKSVVFVVDPLVVVFWLLLVVDDAVVSVDVVASEVVVAEVVPGVKSFSTRLSWVDVVECFRAVVEKLVDTFATIEVAWNVEVSIVVDGKMLESDDDDDDVGSFVSVIRIELILIVVGLEAFAVVAVVEDVRLLVDVVDVVDVVVAVVASFVPSGIVAIVFSTGDDEGVDLVSDNVVVAVWDRAVDDDDDDDGGGGDDDDDDDDDDGGGGGDDDDDDDDGGGGGGDDDDDNDAAAEMLDEISSIIIVVENALPSEVESELLKFVVAEVISIGFDVVAVVALNVALVVVCPERVVSEATSLFVVIVVEVDGDVVEVLALVVEVLALVVEGSVTSSLPFVLVAPTVELPGLDVVVVVAAVVVGDVFPPTDVADIEELTKGVADSVVVSKIVESVVVAVVAAVALVVAPVAPVAPVSTESEDFDSEEVIVVKFASIWIFAVEISDKPNVVVVVVVFCNASVVSGFLKVVDDDDDDGDDGGAVVW